MEFLTKRISATENRVANAASSLINSGDFGEQAVHCEYFHTIAAEFTNCLKQ